MEFKNSKAKPNPWTEANFISRMFLWWLTPLLFVGRNGNLKITDLYGCPKVDSAEEVNGIMQKEWDKELKKLNSGGKPSLIRAAVRAFGLNYCVCGLWVVFKDCAVLTVQPILLGYLIQHFARTTVLCKLYLYLITALFCFLSVINVCIFHPCVILSRRIAIRLKVACCSLIYKKALKLSQASLGKTTVGQMVNLMSNDVNRFDEAAYFLPFLLGGPLQSVIIGCILWMYVGYASLAGLFFLLLFIPIQLMMGTVFSKLTSKTAVLTDERIRLMNEIIGGIRVIKMYGWEMPFAKLVNLSRRKEMQKIRKSFFLRGISVALSFILSKIVLLIAFYVYLLEGKGDLTPEKVFVCLSLFKTIDENVCRCFSTAIAQGVDCVISLKRIQKFLLLEEQEETNRLEKSILRPHLSHCGVWMKKVQASWVKNGEATLNNISLKVKPGELLAVVGPVGCGKTSLLMSILGELPIISGEMKVRGQVAYASQEPWVFTGSVKQNVVFGNAFDEVKYRKVLGMCALDKDIEQFPYGDQTAVGERGVILSGGQKARVSLARAMYFDADIFLLDDPLSAVDASVSKHIFEKCINGYLKDKVRILITHQVQFLKNASRILVLKDGECLAFGKYHDLINAGVDLGSLMHEQDRNTDIDKGLFSSAITASLQEATLSDNSFIDINCEKKDTVHTNSIKAPKEEEIKSSGTVSQKVYKEYIMSSGSLLGFTVLALYIITQALYNGSDFWLTAWTSQEQVKHNIKHCWAGVNKTLLNETGFYNDSCSTFDPVFFRQTVANVSDDCFRITQNYTNDIHDAEEDVKMKFCLSVYAELVFGVLLFCLLRTMAFFEMCTRASVALHEKMFQNVLRTPAAFFDRTPKGQVLNRFSKDAGIIDNILPFAAHDTITLFGIVLGIICVVAIIEPYLLLPAILISTLFVILRQFYLPTLRDVKRYEGITRSPVISHLSTSLHGLTTVRAFKLQRSFEIEFDHHQDQHTATWFIFLCTGQWFSIVLDWLSVVYITCVTVAMVLKSEDPSQASKAGLAMALSVQLIINFQWSVRQSAEVESQMTSVERVMEYSNLKSEAPLESDQDKKPPQNWPSKGSIVYRNVNLKYTPNEPPVLKNLNFEIYPKEKVGVIGRTGAGKSSMIATLFRMAESEGKIIIDGICTKDIGLHDLRKNISVIPQDPILFTGPIRRNLDPFSEYSDTEMWQALKEAHLKETIEDMPGGLDSEVSEDGGNFSVGQRQLLCLARAIVRRNIILVLDEATANVDLNTDSLIQKTIRDRFADCTVVTIAHRLHTIMDSDRILVLDEGEIKEFNKPYKLLQESNSLLTQMVQSTGYAMAEQLRKIAYTTHLKNLNKDKSRTTFMQMNGNYKIKMKDLHPISNSIANGNSIPKYEANEIVELAEVTHL